ncbi:MAG: ParB/RepB/Spo0J family partition protein [Candidatus Omnitrophica bacterium]|nr:ParB/RepB/Spo0J family partition protein [Candidatus Omnitrophota bacterium]MDD5655127.1 ParB/RepB/Spo0J family partition protein [Candidatus Omnitrophota bacterium]
MERKVLGRGISALIPPKELEAGEHTEKIVFLGVDQVQPNPFQPRKEFDSESLEELTQSIREKGIIQPILVRRRGDIYELIAGERRFRAAKSLGINEIPAIIKNVDDEESLEISLIENIQRQELNPIEEAHAYQYLIDKFGLTQESVSDVVGKARVSITNTLRLLKLPLEIQEEIKNGRISYAHGRALLEMDDANKQRHLAQEIISKGLSVRELEAIVKKIRPRSTRHKAVKERDVSLAAKEEALQHVYGTKVKIVRQRKRGHVLIEFYSSEDMDRVINILLNRGGQ